MQTIKLSDCCGAVIVNDGWCVCCDRPCKPKKELPIDLIESVWDKEGNNGIGLYGITK